jgi:hypothetical protein
MQLLLNGRTKKPSFFLQRLSSSQPATSLTSQTLHHAALLPYDVYTRLKSTSIHSGSLENRGLKVLAHSWRKSTETQTSSFGASFAIV